MADNMKLLKHWKLDKMISQDYENSIDSDPIDEISIWSFELDFGPT